MACSSIHTGIGFLSGALAHIDCQAQSIGSFGWAGLADSGSPVLLAVTSLLTIFVAIFGPRLMVGYPVGMRNDGAALLKVGVVKYGHDSVNARLNLSGEKDLLTILWGATRPSGRSTRSLPRRAMSLTTGPNLAWQEHDSNGPTKMVLGFRRNRSGRFMRNVLILVAAVFAGVPAPAFSATTNDYTYDALGRLTSACQSQTGSSFLTRYNLDAAGNRVMVEAANQAFTLSGGSELRSRDGRFIFTMQTDGNLVLYGPSGSMWSSNTYGNLNAFLAFQNDGNLVIYKSDGSGSIWNSATQSNCARLVVQNDGNVVIYSSAGIPIWSTNTGGH